MRADVSRYSYVSHVLMLSKLTIWFFNTGRLLLPHSFFVSFPVLDVFHLTGQKTKIFLFFLHISHFVRLSKETFLCSSAMNMQYSALSLQRSLKELILISIETVIFFPSVLRKCCFYLKLQKDCYVLISQNWRKDSVLLIELSTTGTSVSLVAPYICGYIFLYSVCLISTFLLDAFTTSLARIWKQTNINPRISEEWRFSYGQNKAHGNSAIFHIEIQRWGST